MSGESLRTALRDFAGTGRPPDGARERSWARLSEPRSGLAGLGTGRWVVAALVVAVIAAVTIARWPGSAPRIQAPLRIAWLDATARASTPLRPGARIDARGRDVLVGDGETFLAWLSAGARARVLRHGAISTIQLEEGEARVWSAPRKASEPLEVVTPEHRVRVVGTVFTVRTGPRGDAVWVGRGSVEVRGSGVALAKLRAGARWTSGEEPAAALSAEAVDWLLSRAKEGPRGLRGGSIDRVEPGATSSHAPASSAPRATEPAPRTPQTPPRSGPARAVARAPVVAPTPLVAVPDEPEPVTELSVPAPPVAPAVEPAQEAIDPEGAAARQGIELERMGRFAEALAQYRRLAGGAGGEFALYRAGRLQMRRQHDLAGALMTWREARRRFPAGALRQEIDLSILEALVRSGRRAEAAAEAGAFLRRWPSSERRGEVEAIRERMEASP